MARLYVVLSLLCVLLLAAPTIAATIDGDIMVRTNVRREIIVFVDDDSGGPSDECDNVFVFTAGSPINDSIYAQFDGGSVEYTNTRLKVFDSSEDLQVDVTIDDVSVGPADIIDEHNGIALVHETVSGGYGDDVDELDPDEWQGMMPSCQNCDCAGGTGSSQCSCETNGACSVSCRDGYYACCKTGSSNPRCICCYG